MAGGKGNIRPEDGKQFSSEYQPDEKWTEEKALDIGKKLIEWLKEKEENVFVDDFLVIENDYYETLITYLKGKFTSFSQLLEQAKAIQKTKLIKFGVFDKLNAPMTKFTLINNHGMFDRVEQKTEISGELSQSIKPDLSGGKTDTLKKLKEELEASK
jgi:hypothetical protein